MTRTLVGFNVGSEFSERDKVSDRHLSITSNNRSTESEFVPAGSVTIVGPPAVTSTTLKVNAALIKGTGEPGAILRIYGAGKVLLGSTIIDGDGNWQVTTVGLEPGIHAFNATQSDITGESDPIDAGSVTIAVPLPPLPTVTSTLLDTQTSKATVTGTGVVGAIIKLYADGIFAGTTVVGGDGKFTVITDDALAVGKHSLAITQTMGSGAISESVDAGMVEVAQKTSTSTVAKKTTTKAAEVSATTTWVVPASTTKAVVQTTATGNTFTASQGGSAGPQATSTAAASPAQTTTAAAQQSTTVGTSQSNRSTSLDELLLINHGSPSFQPITTSVDTTASETSSSETATETASSTSETVTTSSETQSSTSQSETSSSETQTVG